MASPGIGIGSDSVDPSVNAVANPTTVRCRLVIPLSHWRDHPFTVPYREGNEDVHLRNQGEELLSLFQAAEVNPEVVWWFCFNKSTTWFKAELLVNVVWPTVMHHRSDSATYIP